MLDFFELKDGIDRAIKTLIQKDAHLLSVDASERSLTHILATRIGQEATFRGWDIDCEYNRNQDDIKRLRLPVETCRSNELSAKSVFPDVIIHKRGRNENLLVIEAKKYLKEKAKDREKIKEYIEQIQYFFGLLLSFPEDSSGRFQCEWWQRNPEGKPERRK